MTDQPAPEIVEQITTAAGHEQQATAPPPQPDVTASPHFRAFVEALLNGKLPALPELPPMDPQVLAIAKELTIIHLPEWRNASGRLIAEPATFELKSAVRIAAYLYQRGMRLLPEHEQIRWIPTPGGPPPAHDDGMHITPDEHGNWPAPDPERFYDIAEITVGRNDDGTWTAIHPRGIQFTGAATKSEAYAGIVTRLRAKIEEANNAATGD
ncbi:hypothetical protein [Nocardia sp. IFM 10818]